MTCAHCLYLPVSEGIPSPTIWNPCVWRSELAPPPLFAFFDFEGRLAGATGEYDSAILPEISPRAPEALHPGVRAAMERSPTPPLPAISSPDWSPFGSESSLGDATMPDATEAAAVGAIPIAQGLVNPTAKGTRRSKPTREDMKRSEMAYNILRHIGIRPYPGKPTRYCTA